MRRMDGSPRSSWSRDEPAFGLMPPADFLGEAGKRALFGDLHVASLMRGRKGTRKLEDRFERGRYQGQTELGLNSKSELAFPSGLCSNVGDSDRLSTHIWKEHPVKPK